MTARPSATIEVAGTMPQRAPYSDVATVLRKLQKCRYCYLAPVPGRGIGVFAARYFAADDIVMQDLDGDFFDRVMSLGEMERSAIFDYPLQVGPDAFRVPVGGIEDFTNHSCNPTTGIRQEENGITVLALRPIQPHDEVTFDYSTWLTARSLAFECRCGAPECRKTVTVFDDLPMDVQRHYITQDVVGHFVLATRGRRS